MDTPIMDGIKKANSAVEPGSDPRQENNYGPIGKAVALLAGSTAALKGGYAGAQRFGESALGSIREEQSKAIIDRLTRAGIQSPPMMGRDPVIEDAMLPRLARFFRKNAPYQVDSIEYALKENPGFYSPISKKIHVPKSTDEAILLHEMGHANQHKHFGKIFTPVLGVSNFLHKLSPVGGVALSALGSDEHRKKAPLLAGLMSAPTLALEAGASHSAIRNLQKLHGGSYLKNLFSPGGKTLMKAFGSYASLPAAGVLGAVAINAIRDKLGKETENENTNA